MKKKVLIVNGTIFNYKKIEYNSYIIEKISLFRRIPFILKPIRLFHLKYNFPFKYIWEIDNLNMVFKGYDIIILHDSSQISDLNRFIKYIENGSNINSKLIFYFWNSVNSFSKLKFSERWDVTTFDYLDSVKFNIRYIGGFYYFENQISNNIIYKKNDVFFVGIDKGRFNILFELEGELKRIGLSPLFIYVSRIKSIYSKLFTKPIPYNEIIKYIIYSKSILDFSKNGQFGLTLRVYESIFYNKKLITNNQSIIKYDFYNENNILIIKGKEEIFRIQEFLNLPFKPYDDDIIERYTLNAFIMRIDNKNECNFLDLNP